MRRRQRHPTPVLLPGKSRGRRSPVGRSPRGRTESDTTERLAFPFSLSRLGEGNGNPPQCSCLENPRDGGARRATVYGVAQIRTRWKRLSSGGGGGGGGSSSSSSRRLTTETRSPVPRATGRRLLPVSRRRNRHFRSGSGLQGLGSRRGLVRQPLLGGAEVRVGGWGRGRPRGARDAGWGRPLDSKSAPEGPPEGLESHWSLPAGVVPRRAPLPRWSLRHRPQARPGLSTGLPFWVFPRGCFRGVRCCR